MKKNHLFTFTVVLIAVLFAVTSCGGEDAVTPPPSTTTTGGSFYMSGDIVGNISDTIYFEINNPTTARAMDSAGGALTGSLKQGDKVYQLSGNYDPDTRAISLSTQSDKFVFAINGTGNADGNIERGNAIVFNKEKGDDKAADTFKIEESTEAVSGGSAIPEDDAIPAEFWGKWYATSEEVKPTNDFIGKMESIIQISPFGLTSFDTVTDVYNNGDEGPTRSSEGSFMIVYVQENTDYTDVVFSQPSYKDGQTDADVIEAFEAYLAVKDITATEATKTGDNINWTPGTPNQWYCEDGTIFLFGFTAIKADREWFDFQIAYLRDVKKRPPVTIYGKLRFWIDDDNKFYLTSYYKPKEQLNNPGHYDTEKEVSSFDEAKKMTDWDEPDNALEPR